MDEPLPLFPLGTVLTPGLVLPLQVFEERYRQLVRDLMAMPDGSLRRFGVVAIRHGREVGADGVRSLYGVGCAAELRQVEEHDDGRFDLLVTGSERFRVRRLDRSGAYLRGHVEWLPEDPGRSEPDQVARTVGALFRTYRGTVVGTGDDDLPPEPRTLSYLVAAAMVLALPERQALLEISDDLTRLTHEAHLLRRENALLRVLPSLPAVDLLSAAASDN